MLTNAEERNEFWLLTKGILEDSKVDTEETIVVKRWLEEHGRGDEFKREIAKLDAVLADGYTDRFESAEITELVGDVLAKLRRRAV